MCHRDDIFLFSPHGPGARNVIPFAISREFQPQKRRKPAKAGWRSRLRGNGRDGKIRTYDPLYPKQVRYQTAPRPDPRHRLAPKSGPHKTKLH